MVIGCEFHINWVLFRSCFHVEVVNRCKFGWKLEPAGSKVIASRHGFGGFLGAF